MAPQSASGGLTSLLNRHPRDRKRCSRHVDSARDDVDVCHCNFHQLITQRPFFSVYTDLTFNPAESPVFPLLFQHSFVFFSSLNWNSILHLEEEPFACVGHSSFQFMVVSQRDSVLTGGLCPVCPTTTSHNSINNIEICMFKYLTIHILFFNNHLIHKCILCIYC